MRMQEKCKELYEWLEAGRLLLCLRRCDARMAKDMGTGAAGHDREGVRGTLEYANDVSGGDEEAEAVSARRLLINHLG